jgi:adenylate kinase family enzyme
LKRLIRFRGTSRPDMGPNCPEKFNWEFFRWIWNFNKSKRKKYYALLNQQTQLHVHIFRNRRQLGKYLTHFSIIE